MAVIEGLAGANYEEIVRDQMITFANYYGMSEEDIHNWYVNVNSENYSEL